ncbi:hypothetical protein RND81_10G005700 [Saponaria officinalis]|uniref:Uncharacterized protein n=1 Tax=Saponaria officinalis TaxID=3572 RepID=A0AAW1HZ63_SAPOF
MQLISLAQAGHELTADLLSSADMDEIQLLVMEGLDALLAKKKNTSTYVEPELNGSSQIQPSPASGWFNSKSSKKVPLSAGLKRLYL